MVPSHATAALIGFRHKWGDFRQGSVLLTCALTHCMSARWAEGLVPYLGGTGSAHTRSRVCGTNTLSPINTRVCTRTSRLTQLRRVRPKNKLDNLKSSLKWIKFCWYLTLCKLAPITCTDCLPVVLQLVPAGTAVASSDRLCRLLSPAKQDEEVTRNSKRGQANASVYPPNEGRPCTWQTCEPRQHQLSA